MKRIKKCLYCGREFSTQSAVKKYCCMECAEAAKQEIKKKRNILLNELAPIANLRQQDYFTFSQAATLMGYSRQYIYKLVTQGKLHASRISDRMAIIRRKDIEDKGLICISMVNTAYPFCYDVTTVLGRYFHAQKKVATTLLTSKLSATYGTNRSLPNGLYCILPMLIEAGFITVYTMVLATPLDTSKQMARASCD